MCNSHKFRMAGSYFSHSTQIFYVVTYILLLGGVTVSGRTIGCSGTSPCVRKCCPTNQVLDINARACVAVESASQWNPIFYRSASVVETNTSAYPPLRFGFPECRRKYMIDGSLPENKLLVNGSIVLLDGERRTYIDGNEFCIDGVHRSGDPGGAEESSDPEKNQVVIACVPKGSI